MKEEQDSWIERRIITGMIISTEYLREVSRVWSSHLIESVTARTLAGWCLDYFNQYNRAPGQDIEGIYTIKLKADLPKEQAEGIELVLQSLSEEYERGQFNVDYLLEETRQYFSSRHLAYHVDSIKGELSSGSLAEAEKLATCYAPLSTTTQTAIDPFGNAEPLKDLFEDPAKPLLHFGRALGDFWDSQFTRDAFVALCAPEKRGKTFWLMEIAMRGLSNHCNVVFFQAGDMSQNQQLRRLYVWLARRSDMARYCNEMYIPVMDCKRNQNGECRRHGSRQTVLDVDTEKLTYKSLSTAYETFPDHEPCRQRCEQCKGAVWFRRHFATLPLDWKEAYRHVVEFRRHNQKKFKLCTYANETLTVVEIKSLLDTWERTEGFVPDIIVIDYADILAVDPDCSRLDFRNQQNKIWQRLRSLSQQRHCLVVTATQAAASSYDKDTIRLRDFSEDKRKYAHVTAMYGLNQTDEEKKIGIMRINELVVREGDFDRTNQVKVLQRLQIGRPFLGSFT